MRTYNTLFDDFKTLQSFMKKQAIQDDSQLLVRIHTGMHTMDTIQPFLKELRSLLPSATILGSSNGAVIYNSKIVYGKCLISFTMIEGAKLQVQLFSTDGKAPEALANEVHHSDIIKHAQAAFIFMNNEYHEISRFIQACNEFASDVKFIGGVNSTIYDKQTDTSSGFIFDQDEVIAHGLVIGSITHPNLFTYSNAILGVEQIGQEYTISKTNGIYIEEINHQNASHWYQSMLEKESFQKDPSICKMFPFILPDQEDSIRLIAYDRKLDKIRWHDGVEELEKIRLGYCSPFVTIEECHDICHDLQNYAAESLFVYSCVTRNDIMNQCCSWELSPFSQTDISGALCGGEFCNVNNRNVYGNITCSIMSLGTNQDARLNIDKAALDKVSNLGFDNQHILTYLLKSASDDMYRTNASLTRQILEQNNQMMETLFIDQATNLPNITKYLYDLEHFNYNKMCIISTQNAGMLRSHYGDDLCTHEIFAKIQRCKEYLNDPELYFYLHNQDCIMICAIHNYSDDRFLQKMKSLFTFLGTIEAKDNNFYYVNEFAVVIHEDQLLEKAELTLSYIERSSQRFLLYYPNLGLEDKVEEELQCLAHIKYAILHDGVEPYFQPIYDNTLHTIQKYESLMRLRTRDGKILFPNQFMDTAKKFKLYEDISRQMIAKVMQLYQNSDDAVTINLSLQDIESDITKNLIYEHLRICQKPENIVFEIVESEEIHKDINFVQFIENIRKQGAKIAIDDFGTGYSNLLKLVKLNADFIKIDGEIIRNMLSDDTCRKILDTILFLSKKMQTELVAEYVETSEIQEEIEHMGIRYSQGYHFSRPRPYSAFYKPVKLGS